MNFKHQLAIWNILSCWNIKKYRKLLKVLGFFDISYCPVSYFFTFPEYLVLRCQYRTRVCICPNIQCHSERNYLLPNRDFYLIQSLMPSWCVYHKRLKQLLVVYLVVYLYASRLTISNWSRPVWILCYGLPYCDCSIINNTI